MVHWIQFGRFGEICKLLEEFDELVRKDSGARSDSHPGWNQWSSRVETRFLRSMCLLMSIIFSLSVSLLLLHLSFFLSFCLAVTVSLCVCVCLRFAPCCLCYQDEDQNEVLEKAAVEL